MYCVAVERSELFRFRYNREELACEGSNGVNNEAQGKSNLAYVSFLSHDSRLMITEVTYRAVPGLRRPECCFP